MDIPKIDKGDYFEFSYKTVNTSVAKTIIHITEASDVPNFDLKYDIYTSDGKKLLNGNRSYIDFINYFNYTGELKEITDEIEIIKLQLKGIY
jgi:hypothetical protein